MPNESSAPSEEDSRRSALVLSLPLSAADLTLSLNTFRRCLLAILLKFNGSTKSSPARVLHPKKAVLTRLIQQLLDKQAHQDKTRRSLQGLRRLSYANVLQKSRLRHVAIHVRLTECTGLARSVPAAFIPVLEIKRSGRNA